MKKYLNRQTMMIGFFVIHFLLLGISYFFLPDTLVMQVNFQGEAGTTLPKILGVLLMLGIDAIINYRFYVDKREGSFLVKAAIVNVLILILEIIILYWNL